MSRLFFICLTNLILSFNSTIFSKPFKVAIANLGPHQSLLDIINGIQTRTKELGLDIEFNIQHVNFDMTQIPKMLVAQKAQQPDAIITVTTSVSQHAKTVFRGTQTPIIFAAITDPVEAKLLISSNLPNNNITGVSDKQDALSVLRFIQHHVPHLKSIGIPYAQNEANDRALVFAFQNAAKNLDIEITPIPVDSLQDLPHRIRVALTSVDTIYVGPSNLIQPALPVIIQQANCNKIPVFNFNEAAVTSHQAFGSFSVNYVQLGQAVATILQQLINNTPIGNIPPVYPQASEHYGTVSLKVAQRLNITPPKENYPSVTYVGQ